MKAFETDERVIARYGVMYQGWDLTDQVGIVQSIDSYVVVYFPQLNLEAKMLAYEIEHYPRDFLSDLWR